MPKWVLWVLGVLMLAGGAGWWLVGRPQPSDQEQVYRLVINAQDAAQRKDARDLLALLSEDYLDHNGYNKRDMTRWIISGLRTAEPITVVPEVKSLQVTGDRAELALAVRLWLGDPATTEVIPLTMQIGLQREGRRWRITSARGWEQTQEAYWN